MNAKRPFIFMRAGSLALLITVASPNLFADTAAQPEQSPGTSQPPMSGLSTRNANPQEAEPTTTREKTQAETTSPSSADMAANEEYPPLEATQTAPAGSSDPNKTQPETTQSSPASTTMKSKAASETDTVPSKSSTETTETEPETPTVHGQAGTDTTETAAAQATVKYEAQTETAEVGAPYYSPYYEYWGNRSRHIRERNATRRKAIQERSAQLREWADQRRRLHQLNNDARRWWTNPRGAYLNDLSRARQAHFDQLAEERMKHLDSLYGGHPWGPYYYH